MIWIWLIQKLTCWFVIIIKYFLIVPHSQGPKNNKPHHYQCLMHQSFKFQPKVLHQMILASKVSCHLDFPPFVTWVPTYPRWFALEQWMLLTFYISSKACIVSLLNQVACLSFSGSLSWNCNHDESSCILFLLLSMLCKINI